MGWVYLKLVCEIVDRLVSLRESCFSDQESEHSRVRFESLVVHRGTETVTSKFESGNRLIVNVFSLSLSHVHGPNNLTRNPHPNTTKNPDSQKEGRKNENFWLSFIFSMLFLPYASVFLAQSWGGFHGNQLIYYVTWCVANYFPRVEKTNKERQTVPWLPSPPTPSHPRAMPQTLPFWPHETHTEIKLACADSHLCVASMFVCEGVWRSRWYQESDWRWLCDVQFVK